MPNTADFPILIDEDGAPFVQLNDYKFKIELEELTGDWKQRAINELRETPENVENGLTELRKLIQTEPNWNIPIDDTEFLLKFLRPCKYYPESAFKIMKKFYGFRVKFPKYCMNIYPNDIRHVFDNEVFFFMPTRSPVGARIKLVNVGSKWNPKVVTLEDMFKAVMVGTEVAMREPKSQLGGAEVILNMEGLALTHVYQFSPSLAKLMADWVQTCTPVRLKGIHVINQPYIFKLLWTMFKPFLGEKLRKRIFFHGYNKKSLFEKIPAECLPPCIGGTANLPDYPGSVFSEMLYYYEDDFIRFNKYGYTVDANGKEIVYS